ncbi:MAG: phosphatidate cytidylyltransferase, partial [Acidimicrobiia bacterium]
AGRRFGRRPLTRVSPNKTVEGLVAGMIGSVVLAVTVVATITPWDRLSALALGVVVAVLAPLGDLCESMLKRDLGVKDLGGLLPGHGGVLDRFDAILFCLPAVYYLIRLLELN